VVRQAGGPAKDPFGQCRSAHLSILPPAIDQKQTLRPWAANLRDNDERWQKLSQDGVQLFMGLIMDQHMPFAFETVFSYLERQADGTYKSKVDTIVALQKAGYFVVLVFVGLASAELSILRVNTRRLQGGPRTQEAIRLAAPLADMTFMFDNSRAIDNAFSLVRFQARASVLYDCPRHGIFPRAGAARCCYDLAVEGGATADDQLNLPALGPSQRGGGGRQSMCCAHLCNLVGSSRPAKATRG
jgi:predicted ABC-type ATPase